MRSFILLLKRIGLQRIVGVFIALVLIMVAVVYIVNQPKVLDPNLQSEFDQGKYADAIPKVEKWIAENPKDVNATEVLAALYIQKASNEPQAKAEALVKARKLIGTIIKIDPTRDESFRLLGVTYLMADNTKLAAENFMKAVKISKNANIEAQVGLAMIDEHDRQWEKAFSEYQTILAKDPKNEAANLGVARYYISISDANEAMDSAWLVAHASANNASLGEAYSILGSGMKILKQPEISKGYFEKSISYRPNDEHTLVLLGESYIALYPLAKAEDRQATIDKVVSIANQAAALDPLYVHSQTLLYKALLLQNKYAEANAVGQKIVALLPIDKTLTDSEKAEYKKFYGGKITDVKINSVKVIDPNVSAGSSSSAKAATSTAKTVPAQKAPVAKAKKQHSK